jgi:hypothetical protein
MRWNDPTADRWPGRNAAVARHIPVGSSVIDLGAGAGGLVALLEGCTYTGVDLPDFDMNRHRWPTGRYDVAVMAGVLEYSRFPAAALRHLHELAPVAIVTYSHGGRLRDRDWNDLSPERLVELTAKAGYTATEVGSWRTRGIRPQTIWRLS